MNPGKLYLIPTVIADDTQATAIPPQVRDVLPGITHFLAENIRTARRYLSSLKIYQSIESLHFEVMNKDSVQLEMKELLKPVFDGYDVGILSESGCPGVADPGALAVKFAHENDIRVIPLIGPSSILLALMASGLNGQRFAFQGYLPINSKEAIHAIREYEKESQQKGQTQIFIETPYRSDALFHLLINTLNVETFLSVAVNITGEGEEIKTYPVKRWKQMEKRLPKAPTVFSFLA